MVCDITVSFHRSVLGRLTPLRLTTFPHSSSALSPSSFFKSKNWEKKNEVPEGGVWHTASSAGGAGSSPVGDSHRETFQQSIEQFQHQSLFFKWVLEASGLTKHELRDRKDRHPNVSTPQLVCNSKNSLVHPLPLQ